MKEHQECYGKLFPSIENSESNLIQKGKVFSFRLDRPRVLAINRVTEEDSKQWDECIQCPEFDVCYKLSMAKFALEQAVRTYA